ncbi:hypothetical protein [Burkholderia ubonensis]|nr:hypothetical protein [Burkholderia ubonensis]
MRYAPSQRFPAGSSGIGFAIATVGFFLLTRWKVPPLVIVVPSCR